MSLTELKYLKKEYEIAHLIFDYKNKTTKIKPLRPTVRVDMSGLVKSKLTLNFAVSCWCLRNMLYMLHIKSSWLYIYRITWTSQDIFVKIIAKFKFDTCLNYFVWNLFHYKSSGEKGVANIQIRQTVDFCDSWHFNVLLYNIIWNILFWLIEQSYY